MNPCPDPQVTLLGLWLMPAIFSVQLKFWRFLVIWAGFTGVTLYLLWLCLGKKKVDMQTPRKVGCARVRAGVCVAVSQGLRDCHANV